MITNTAGYSWDLNPALTLPSDLLNSCNTVDLWVGNNQAPLYSGTLATYNPGSSLSHLDESCVSGSNYVLNPTISPGLNKRTVSTTERQLISDLGFDVNGYSTCIVVGVDDVNGNCTKTFIVNACPGHSMTITTADLIANDQNAIGAVDVELVGNVGSLQMVTAGSQNSDYIFYPAVNGVGDFVIRYRPVGCGGLNWEIRPMARFR